MPAGGLEEVVKLGIQFVLGESGGFAHVLSSEEIEEVVAEDGKEP